MRIIISGINIKSKNKRAIQIQSSVHSITFRWPVRYSVSFPFENTGAAQIGSHVVITPSAAKAPNLIGFPRLCENRVRESLVRGVHAHRRRPRRGTFLLRVFTQWASMYVRTCVLRWKRLRKHRRAVISGNKKFKNKYTNTGAAVRSRLPLRINPCANAFLKDFFRVRFGSFAWRFSSRIKQSKRRFKNPFRGPENVRDGFAWRRCRAP